jgi:hypothetical protein
LTASRMYATTCETPTTAFRRMLMRCTYRGRGFKLTIWTLHTMMLYTARDIPNLKEHSKNFWHA